MPNTEIQALIQSFAAQLEAAAKKAALEQVIASLGGSAGPARRRGRGPGRPKGSTNRPAAAPASSSGPVIKPVKAGQRRTAEDVEQMGAALIAHVKANPGTRGEQIAAALRSDVGTIRLPMKALIAAKKIKTQGERRGMKYFAAGASIPGSSKSAGRRKGRRTKR